MTKIVSRGEKRNSTKNHEPKTLFEHMGLTKKKGAGFFDKITKYLKSMALFVVIGYLVGTILDIMLKSNLYAPILAIGLLLVWILKVFGTDLKPPVGKNR